MLKKTCQEPIVNLRKILVNNVSKKDTNAAGIFFGGRSCSYFCCAAMVAREAKIGTRRNSMVITGQ